MPLVRDEFLDCALYLYPSVADAQAGARIGGSGFLVSAPAKKIPKAEFLYAVTNRHVIESGATVIRLNTESGGHDVLDLSERDWMYHPEGDDIAVAGPIPLHQDKYRRKYVGLDMFLTKDQLTEFDIGPGDEAFIVGRFINHEGRQRNLPTVRFGNIAQNPFEPIRQPRGLGYFEQESFLVEARSIGGYSGSPVFIEVQSTIRRHLDKNRPSSRFFFLGVDWGHLLDMLPILGPDGKPVGSNFVRANTGMACVIPAWKLHDFLMLPALDHHRDQQEEVYLASKANEAVAEPDVIQLLPTAIPVDGAEDVNPHHKEDFTALLNAAVKKPKEGA